LVKCKPVQEKRSMCDTCVTSLDCKDGLKCCSRMKRCIQNAQTTCLKAKAKPKGFYTHCSANEHGTSCTDEICNKDGSKFICSLCNCTGKATEQDWLEWANRRGKAMETPGCKKAVAYETESASTKGEALPEGEAVPVDTNTGAGGTNEGTTSADGEVHTDTDTWDDAKHVIDFTEEKESIGEAFPDLKEKLEVLENMQNNATASEIKAELDKVMDMGVKKLAEKKVTQGKHTDQVKQDVNETKLLREQLKAREEELAESVKKVQSDQQELDKLATVARKLSELEGWATSAKSKEVLQELLGGDSAHASLIASSQTVSPPASVLLSRGAGQTIVSSADSSAEKQNNTHNLTTSNKSFANAT